MQGVPTSEGCREPARQILRRIVVAQPRTQVAREEDLGRRRALEAWPVREERIVERHIASAEERGEILRRLLLQARDVGIELAEEVRAHARPGLAAAEPADPRLLEDIVAGKDLVGPFARQNHLQPLLPDET
ncbi:hypothetical protein D9M72_507850 [compost metagenome]